MTQEDKDLLLKDLCGRLPHGVKVNADYINFNRDGKLFSINNNEELILSPEKGYSFDVAIEKCKPYLFPLSSMTGEQINELKSYVNLKWEHNTLELVEWDNNYKTLEFWLEEIPSYHVIKVFDWLNKNHFDYRGLIEKGLAINATDKNIY